MKRPTTLLEWLLRNEADQLNLTIDRDLVTIRDRFEHEGMSFLTIALPLLSDALEEGLSVGRITPKLFVGFQPHKRGGSLPALLSGFFMRVFEEDGHLMSDPCVASIRAIRQVARFFKKVELPCSPAKYKTAFEKYRSTDVELPQEDSVPTALHETLCSVGYTIWSHLEDLVERFYCSTGVFGGGATQERLKPNGRKSLKEWPTRGELTFPPDFYCSHGSDPLVDWDPIPFCKEKPVRVVAVPKTLKTPRIIAVEPSYMMLKQQSIAKPLMSHLESPHFQFDSIRFSDQTVNRRLAKLGSETMALSTIDLSDASDRVSLWLVRRVFASCPGFLQFLLDSRSRIAELPDGTRVTLRKFASQGSALCFPVEAMVFFTLVLVAKIHAEGRQLSLKQLKEYAANVSVYGDDIVVPTEMAAVTMEVLETFGLKVNHGKSYWTGSFRESCGGDYYKGHDITPVYCRQFDFTAKLRDPRDLAAYVSMSNQLYMKGLWNVAQNLRGTVESTIRRKLPRTQYPIGCLAWTSVSYNTGLSFDDDRYGYRVKSLRLVDSQQDDPHENILAALYTSFQARALNADRKRFSESPNGDDEYPSRSYRGSSAPNDGSGDCSGLALVGEGYRQFHDPKRVLECQLEGVPRDLSELIPGSDAWVDSWNTYNKGLSAPFDKYAIRNLGHLGPVETGSVSTSQSVRPYSSKVKSRWTPTYVGLQW